VVTKHLMVGLTGIVPSCGFQKADSNEVQVLFVYP